MNKPGRAVREKAAMTARSGTPKAVAAWLSGDLASAEAHWRGGLLRNPKDPVAPRALSDIAHQSGRYEEAAQPLRPFAATAPEYANLGVALEAIGQTNEAEAAYRKAVALDPKLASARCNLGNLLQRQQRAAEAAQEFRAALALRSDYARAWT